jgi:hypothetical protein
MDSLKKAKDSIKDRTLEGGRMGIFDDGVNTNLISKDYSPLIVRKYNIVRGWPMFIALICDYSLSDLDNVVNSAIDECEENGLINNDIQNMRNITGYISDKLVKYYNSKKKNCVEGVLVFLYVDKLAISSAFGDLMNHEKCVAEVYSILNLMTKI